CSSALRPLDAVLRPALGPVRLVRVRRARGARRVQRATDDVIAHAREVLHTTAADEHDAVLLQVVALTRDVGRDLDAVREPDTSHLPERGVRLLRGGRVDTHADAALLRAVLQRGRRGLGARLFASGADELIDRGHACFDKTDDAPGRSSDVGPGPRGGGRLPVTLTLSRKNLGSRAPPRGVAQNRRRRPTDPGPSVRSRSSSTSGGTVRPRRSRCEGTKLMWASMTPASARSPKAPIDAQLAT